MKPQEHIDLSLKLMRRTTSNESDKPPSVRHIEVSEIGSRFANDQTSKIIDHPIAKIPMHMTRVDKKRLSLQVKTSFPK